MPFVKVLPHFFLPGGLRAETLLLCAASLVLCSALWLKTNCPFFLGGICLFLLLAKGPLARSSVVWVVSVVDVQVTWAV